MADIAAVLAVDLDAIVQGVRIEPQDHRLAHVAVEEAGPVAVAEQSQRAGLPVRPHALGGKQAHRELLGAEPARRQLLATRLCSNA